MDKMERDRGNKTQRLYRCCSNYALSKLIMGNRFEDLWRKENPYSSDFPPFDRSSGTRSRIDRVYTDKIANNTKINHIIVSFTDHKMLFLLKDSLQKLKLEKTHGILIILFYVTSSSAQLQRICFFVKNKKSNHPSASAWWVYTKSCFKENAGTFSKISFTQENIRISRLKKDYETYTRRKMSNQKLSQ